MNGPTAQLTRETAPRWELVGNVLAIREAGGKLRTPDTDQIYRVFIDEEPVAGLPGSSEGLPGIREFSRYPLDVALVVAARNAGAGPGMECRIAALSVGNQVPLADTAVSAGHIVVDECWYPLVPGSIAEVRALMDGAGVAAPGAISLGQYLRLRKEAGSSARFIDQATGMAAASQSREDELQLPQGFEGNLYPYQRTGWQWLSRLAAEDLGAILADEMGLGKTVQLIVLMLQEHAAGRGPSLVVAPATLLENWRREIRKFASSLHVEIHQGAQRTGLPSGLKSTDVVIISYDTLVRDVLLLRQLDWNCVVLDEAQAVKNPDTRRWKAVRQVPRRVCVAVTGTPVENRLTDLWSLAELVLPGFLGARSEFERKYADNHDGAASIEPLVSPVMLRRRVSEVAQDLPERIIIPQPLELDADSATRYDQVRKQIEEEYGDRASLVALTKLRMFCTHPALTGGVSGNPAEASNKYQRLVEILEEIFSNGQKALVFTSFSEMIDILVADVSCRFGVPAASIDGRTPVAGRQPMVDEFSAVSGAALLALNPRAAGTGLNITAANHVIHYNPEWNPALEDQATARVYRRGQTLPVTVHRLFYAGTVEEVIDERLNRKRVLAAAAVVGSEGNEELADVLSALRISPVRRRI